MTWNIHGGLGTDRRFDLARVVETILRHHPDAVALQEVDLRRTVAPESSAFRVLRGGGWGEAKSIIAPDGEYARPHVGAKARSNSAHRKRRAHAGVIPTADRGQNRNRTL
jgi:endonuclease/exonuclease/phosphatase family metal-dependent hydrolase